MQENKQEKSPIKARIIYYLKNKGISNYEFYKESGVSRGVLSQSNGLSEDNIARFLAYAPDVNAEWLVTGQGSMSRSDKKEDLPCAVPVDGNDGIPLIPISAMAGFGEGDSTVLEYECDRYVIPAFREAEFLIQVKGSSMYPKYSSGDIVACKKLPIDTFFQWNKVYVLDTEQGALIKRVKDSGKEDTLLIVSDNPSYEPFELHRRHIRSVAIVVGVVRLE